MLPNMGGPMGSMLDGKLSADNMLTISWVDSSWVPILNAGNVMDYFSEQRNPFYDRTCNNEMLKMQRASMDQLANMVGIEYCLLYVQEPILYVIRKQQRHSPSQVTPVTDYYIVAGTIYQAPDLGSVINSRLLSAVSHLQGAFEEARGYAKYHPSKGYWWDFQKDSDNKFGPANKKPAKDTDDKDASKKEKTKEEPSSLFQRRRVDMLLDLLTKRFPFKVAPAPAQPPNATAGPGQGDAKSIAGDDVKSEKGAESIKSEKAENVDNSRGIKREREPVTNTNSKLSNDSAKKTKFS